MGPKTEVAVSAAAVWVMAGVAAALTALSIERAEGTAIGMTVAAPVVTALAWWMHDQDKRTERRRRELLARIDELSQDRSPGSA